MRANKNVFQIRLYGNRPHCSMAGIEVSKFASLTEVVRMRFPYTHCCALGIEYEGRCCLARDFILFLSMIEDRSREPLTRSEWEKNKRAP